MINNFDMFKEFFEFANNNTLEEVLKEWGGGNLYIPSDKTTIRNKEIIEDFENGMKIHKLRQKYQLSDQSIRRIIRGNK